MKSGRGDALLEIGHRLGDHQRRRRDCGRRRARSRHRRGRAATSAPAVSRCMRAGQSTLMQPGLDRRGRHGEAGAAQRRDGGAGIGELVAADAGAAPAGRAGRPRPGRPAGRARRGRSSRGWPTKQRRAQPGGLVLDHVDAPTRRCGRDDDRPAALDDAGLLAGDLRRACRRGTSRGRCEIGVITATRGSATTLVASKRPPRPTSSSETVGRMVGEELEGGGGGDLELR